MTVEIDIDEEFGTEGFSEEDIIRSVRAQLLVHAERQAAFFFVERSPPSGRRGAGCQFISCEDKIRENDYRIAVHPGMNNNADFYHVKCFEKLADFAKTEWLTRLAPLSRVTFPARGLKATSLQDGDYLVDGGAEKLILHWKSSMGRLIDERDGVEHKPEDPDFVDLIYKAGSASFAAKQPEGLGLLEYGRLLGCLAPIETDGPGDAHEWNLIEEYSPLRFDDLDDLKQTNILSSMLEKWRFNSLLASSEDGELSERGKELRNQLGEKAIRVITRLSIIPMPNFQAAVFGGNRF